MLIHAERLGGVHPDLRRVVLEASGALDLAILEGLRTVERERELMAAGHSALRDPYRCRHVSGHAVDLAPVVGGQVRWDWPGFYPIARAMKAAARRLDVPIEWGGDWARFKDGPHFQLPWRTHPWTPPPSSVSPPPPTSESVSPAG